MAEELSDPTPMPTEDTDRREQFAHRVAAAVSRHRARERHRHSPWWGLGTFGVVGWSVALPTLLGLAIGALVDRHVVDGRSWRLAGLLAGLVVGAMNAWYWVARESRGEP